MRQNLIRVSVLAALLSATTLSFSQQSRPTSGPPSSLPGYGAVSNWGCEVMLCLADPNGPMDKAECRPSITRLYRAIFRWRPQPFPVCLLSNGGDSRSTGNYAQVGPPSYYDACPTGTTALPLGEGALVNPPPPVGAVRVGQPATTSVYYSGIGDGSTFTPSMGDSGDPMPTKVCVGPVIGQTVYMFGSGDSADSRNVNVYSNVVLIPPSPNSFTVEVYINNQLYRSVRPGVVQ
jgi:hypothetical protein